MPAGTTPQEREEFQQMMKWQGWMNGAMEFCPLKVALAGGMGESLITAYRITSCVSLYRANARAAERRIEADLMKDSVLVVSSPSCRLHSHTKIPYPERLKKWLEQKHSRYL